MSVSEYLLKMKSYADFLRAVSHEISEEDLILHVLTSLGSEYDSFADSLTSTTEFYSLRDVSA